VTEKKARQQRRAWGQRRARGREKRCQRAGDGATEEDSTEGVWWQEQRRAGGRDNEATEEAAKGKVRT
jgi:hypothetical protein